MATDSDQSTAFPMSLPIPLGQTQFQTSGRRRISLREALLMADEIMRRAEEGRLKAAEDEANRQLELEDRT